MGMREYVGRGLVLVALLCLEACAQPAAPAPAAATQPQASAQATPTTEAAATVKPADTQTDGATNTVADNPYAFTVRIDLSPVAAQQLARHNETIMASAFYYGVPKANAPAKVADEMGQVHLGNQEIELREAGDAVFDGRAVDHKPLAYVDGDPQVNVNVYSGRHSSEDNLLNCDFFEDAVQIAHAKPIAIHCGLIGE